MFHYHQAKVLCEQIKRGEEIHTDFSNGTTAPIFWNDIAHILQMDGPQIPLVVACYYGNMQAVETLLQNGADPNYFMKGEWSPLEAAYLNPRDDGTNEKSFEMIQMLVEYGANVNAYGGDYPLIVKLSGNLYLGDDRVIVKNILLYLLDHGASKEWDGDDHVFYGAVGGGHVTLAEQLVEQYGCDVNRKCSQDGKTMLMVHILNPNLTPKKEMVNLLLRYGADKSICDDAGKTAYDYAVEKGYTEIAELLK